MSIERVLIPDDALLEEEHDIQECVRETIFINKNFVFDAGAGAGKTFSLVESLRFVLRHSGETLKNRNQKILCITYTNVAVDEINERLGNTNLVIVSTIHELMWRLIKRHKEALVKIHAESMWSQVEKLKFDLFSSYSKLDKFSKLSNDDKLNFISLLVQNKELYHSAYSKPAGEFRAMMSIFNDNYPVLMKNVTDFKKLCSAVLKFNNFTSCIKSISLRSEGYREVRYDSGKNNDSLHRMRISHGTLLNYSLEMVRRHDMLKQILIDCYPIVFIDEYQDTAPRVVRVMHLLSDYSVKIGHPLLVGYFGDKAQNIYDDGIGGDLCATHAGLLEIDKPFNRRSTNEIISVINRIRSDKMEQVSIYEGFSGDNVEFYHAVSDDKIKTVNSFIDIHKKQWGIREENKLHCLVLTNKILSQLAGFQNVYEFFAKSDLYSTGLGYMQINTEIFSNQESKLGESALFFYNIMKFRSLVSEGTSSISGIIDRNSISHLTIEALRSCFNLISQIDGDSMRDYIHSFIDKINELNEVDSLLSDSILKRFWKCNKFDIDVAHDHVFRSLFFNIDYDNDEKMALSKKIVDDLFDINIDEWDMWYGHVSGSQASDTVFHTYHGTKGAQFKNVLIFMEDDFGKERGKFPFFFSNVINSGDLKNEDLIRYTSTRNLLYVSCSRAIENLRVLYLGDIEAFKNGILHIFDSVHDCLAES